MTHETADPKADRHELPPQDNAPGGPVNPARVCLPAAMLDRVELLVGIAYEATWTAADTGARVDWSVIGEPIAEALELVRAARR